MVNTPLTCEIRYHIDKANLAEFLEYAQIWIALIKRYGGTHHGYFVPRDKPTEVGRSFPGVSREGGSDTAIALFTFPDEATYLNYRSKIADDPDGIAANERFGDHPPFHSYERLFLQPFQTS